MKLTAVFEPAEEGGFVCWLEEMPGVQSQGDTLEEARGRISYDMGKSKHGRLDLHPSPSGDQKPSRSTYLPTTRHPSALIDYASTDEWTVNLRILFGG
jgi:hypothetical protein